MLNCLKKYLNCIKKTKDDDLSKPIHIFYCFDCKRYFYTKKQYDKHMKKNHKLQKY